MRAFGDGSRAICDGVEDEDEARDWWAGRPLEDEETC